MDRFVIKTPRQIPQNKAIKPADKELKQTTLLSLKHVVVVEDVRRAKILLEGENESIIVEELLELQSKIPPRAVLEETKIGLTLNKLRKHKNPRISQLSKDIYRQWKSHFKHILTRPRIEVRFDNDTTKCRLSGQKLVEDSLSSVEDAKGLAEAIEKCVFELNGNCGNSYRKHMRLTVFTLRHQPDIKKKVVKNCMTVKELCHINFNPESSRKPK